MRFTKRKVKAGASPELSERDKFIKGLLDAVNDVYINHQGGLSPSSFDQNTDRLLDTVEENYPEHLPALEHAINNPANPMENEKQKSKWGIIASLLLTDISNDKKSQDEVLKFVNPGTSNKKGSVYNYLKEYGVDKLKKIMKNSEQNEPAPPEPIVEDSENNSEPEAKEAKKLKPKKKSGGLKGVLEDLIKQQEEISKLDISDEVKLKRLHSLENDIIKDANLERFIVNFLKAKQELELQLNRPLIFGGAIRKFLTKDEAEAFIKARQKPGVKISAKLVNKDDSLEEKIKKIKDEDEKNKTIEKFLKKETKKGSNQRNQEVITQLASVGFVTKGARSVKTLDKVPEKVLDNKVVGILPEYSKNTGDGSTWQIVTEYENDKRYENKFLFALRNYDSPEQVIRLHIPYVNGIINERYIHLETLLDRKLDEIINSEDLAIINDAGIKTNVKIFDNRKVIMITGDTVFDMLAFDIDTSASKNFEFSNTNVKKTLEKAKEGGVEKVREEIIKLLPLFSTEEGLKQDIPDDEIKVFVDYLEFDNGLRKLILEYIADNTLIEKNINVTSRHKPTDISNQISRSGSKYILAPFTRNKYIKPDADEYIVSALANYISEEIGKLMNSRNSYKYYYDALVDKISKGRDLRYISSSVKAFNTRILSLKSLAKLGLGVKKFLSNPDKINDQSDIIITSRKRLDEYNNVSDRMEKMLKEAGINPITGRQR